MFEFFLVSAAVTAGVIFLPMVANAILGDSTSYGAEAIVIFGTVGMIYLFCIFA